MLPPEKTFRGEGGRVRGRSGIFLRGRREGQGRRPTFSSALVGKEAAAEPPPNLSLSALTCLHTSSGDFHVVSQGVKVSENIFSSKTFPREARVGALCPIFVFLVLALPQADPVKAFHGD